MTSFCPKNRNPNPKAIYSLTINRDERSFLLNRPLQNQRIISPRLACFLGANDIMPGFAQKRGQFDPKHLIQV